MTLKKDVWLWRGLALLTFLLVLNPARAQTASNPVTVTAEVQSTNSLRSVTTVVETLGREGLSFGLDRVPALRAGLFGIPLWQYLAAVIFVVLAFNVSKLLEWMIGTQVRHWASRRPTQWGPILIQAVHGPVKVVTFVVLLHLGLEVFTWPLWLKVWISRGLLLVVAFSITYMVLKFIDVVVSFWSERARTREDRIFNDHLFPVITNSLKAFVVVVAVLVTCQNLGLNITAMLASLSIGGLALGFIEIMTVAFFPDLAGYRDAFAFVLLILVLMYKPTGLLGERLEDKV